MHHLQLPELPQGGKQAWDAQLGFSWLRITKPYCPCCQPQNLRVRRIFDEKNRVLIYVSGRSAYRGLAWGPRAGHRDALTGKKMVKGCVQGAVLGLKGVQAGAHWQLSKSVPLTVRPCRPALQVAYSTRFTGGKPDCCWCMFVDNPGQPARPSGMNALPDLLSLAPSPLSQLPP